MNKKGHLKLINLGHSYRPLKQNRQKYHSLSYLGEKELKPKQLHKNHSLLNSNQSEISRKPLNTIKTESAHPDLNRNFTTDMVEHDDQFWEMKETKQVRELKEQISQLRVERQCLRDQICKYEREEQENRLMQEQLQFRKEQQFQIFQHLRNFEKFNQILTHQIKEMDLVIKNYEQIAFQEYQTLFGRYDYSKINILIYQSTSFEHSSKDELPLPTDKYHQQTNRKNLTISIIENYDNTTNQQPPKIDIDSLNLSKSIASQKQNHPLTPKSQISMNLLEREGISFRRRSMDPKSIRSSIPNFSFS